MNPNRPLYLDHNATTPCDARVRQEMDPYFSDAFWNPSSSHVLGRKAFRALEEARCRSAVALGVDPEDVVFTSGATEAINLALERLPEALIRSTCIYPSPVEHRAVQNALQRLQRRGATVKLLPTGIGGIVNLSGILEPSIYVVQAANSETGVKQDIAAISEAVRTVGGLLICDAAQALWKMHSKEFMSYADAIVLSAHKAYGPKGVGALIATSDFRRLLRKDFPESAQEALIREGTVNVASAVGFARTMELVADESHQWRSAANATRDAFEAALERLSPGELVTNLKSLPRLVNTSSIWVKGQQGDAVVVRASKIAISYGSACSSGAPEPSPVLVASGLTRQVASESVRVSFGRDHSPVDGEFAASELSSL